MKFIHLPLGTRFKYEDMEDVFIVLERHGCGKVAKWIGVEPAVVQEVFSAGSDREETEEIEVIVVDDMPESKISMGEDNGWVSGPHDAVNAVQKLIIAGEGYRKEIHELKAQSEIDTKRFLDEFNVVADLQAKIHKLESKREYAIEAMRAAQGLLKDGGQGSIVDTVWVDDKSNTTLWELLEMAIDGD